jgi:type II secretory pathway pseudopilin PulG
MPGAVPPLRRDRREAGYNLVMLIVAVTVLNILLAASLPLWSTAIQREKEEELIFRGLQYADAIRIFKQKFSRPPTRLEELIEAEPRTIRQLWKDPMTEDGKWALIFENQGQGQPLTPQPEGRGGGGQRGRRQVEPDEEELDGSEEGGEESQPTFGPRSGEKVAVGPLRGVHSRSHKESIMLWNGRQRYDEWHFTDDLLSLNPQRQAIAPGIGNPGAPPPAPLSPRWIGRPLPKYLAQGGMMPQDGSGPGGMRGMSDSDGRPNKPGFRPAPGSGSRRRPSEDDD